MTHRLFVWNAYHNGDVLLSRPIVRHLLDRFDVDITWCCWKNHEVLIRDLPIKLLVLPHADGTARDMSLLCPPDHAAIDLWIGHYPDTHDIQWHNCVTVFNRQIREKNLPLEITSNIVPMFDLPDLDISIRDRAIFVDNGAARSTQSWFEFDMPRLASSFPDLNFYCSADPRCSLPNVINCSRVNLLALASISNRCSALVGKGTGAHTCTFTEINRFKPKALMQFRMPAGTGYWDYPGSHMVRLNTHAELVAFLAGVQQRRGTSLLDNHAGLQGNALAAGSPAGPTLAKIAQASTDDLRRLGLEPKPQQPQTPPPASSAVQVLSRTATGAPIISFGGPPAQSAPAGKSLEALLASFRATGDAGDFESLCRQRRQLATELVDLPAGQMESRYTGELAKRHRLLAGSRLPLLPAPAADLSFVKLLEERLASGFSIGTYLAGLLFRPPRFWRFALKPGDVPGWLFQACPSQPLAADQVRSAPEDRQFVAKLFADARLDPARTIAIFAGSDEARKIYPHLGRAVQPLCAQGDWHVVALGAHADAGIHEQCLRESAAPCTANWSGRLTWFQMVEVIRACRLALGVEHPLAHAACALDTPNVVVLGGGNFGINMPYSPSTSVVAFPLSCYSCGWDCPFSRAHCVVDISPEVVELAVQEALKTKAAHPRVYLRYPGLDVVPQGVQASLNVDLLPPMLLEFIYALPENSTVKMPDAICGCPVRGVIVPRRGPALAQPRIQKSTAGTFVTFGR